MKMMITFGQAHVHTTPCGKTLDKDCVAIIYGHSREACDKKASDWFDGRFHKHVMEEDWDSSKMHFFPRGYIEVNPPMMFPEEEL